MNLNSLRKALIRLPLNIKSNRWFVFVGRSLYIHSSTESRAWAKEARSASLSSEGETFRVYQGLHTWFRARKIDRADDAILIPHLGRFGNAVRELVSALAVAKKLNLGHVYLAGDNVFARNSDVPHPGIHQTPESGKLWIDRDPVAKAPFARLTLWSRASYTLASGDHTEVWESARIALGLQPQPSSTTTLTIHLRGGDVFGTRDVGSYGQPPLAFYEKLLEHQAWRHVHIVFQDTQNPVMPGLIQLCERKKLGYTTQSGDLKDDIETLLGATNLAAGRGTFIPAIVGLSPHIKQVYFFEDKFQVVPPRSGFKMWRVHDTVGEYQKQVLNNNWHNTKKQRELMTAYPATHLDIEPIS